MTEERASRMLLRGDRRCSAVARAVSWGVICVRSACFSIWLATLCVRYLDRPFAAEECVNAALVGFCLSLLPSPLNAMFRVHVLSIPQPSTACKANDTHLP